jgi:hypothetical protein
VSPWTYAWLAWGAVFGVLEYKAVKRKGKFDTLSSQVWWVRDHVPFARWALGGGLAWLVIHFMFEG